MAIIRTSKYATTGILEYPSTGDTQYVIFGIWNIPGMQISHYRDICIFIIAGHRHVQIYAKLRLSHIPIISDSQHLQYKGISIVVIFEYLPCRCI